MTPEMLAVIANSAVLHRSAGAIAQPSLFSAWHGVRGRFPAAGQMGRPHR